MDMVGETKDIDLYNGVAVIAAEMIAVPGDITANGVPAAPWTCATPVADDEYDIVAAGDAVSELDSTGVNALDFKAD